jgi:2-furoate---CoA ligase
MFDLGRTFLAAVERSSDATAITDGEQRLGYAAWYKEIAHLAGGLTALGLRRGDGLAVILQNRLEMASLHWACRHRRDAAQLAHQARGAGLLPRRLRGYGNRVR